MSGILYERVSKKRTIVLGISKDWNTLTPWAYKGEIVPYVGVRKNLSDSGNVKFTYMFLGSFFSCNCKVGRLMVTDINHAMRIVAKMAKERYNTPGDVLTEFLKYQKDGECTHFWPDENTACKMLIERRVSQ